MLAWGFDTLLLYKLWNCRLNALGYGQGCIHVRSSDLDLPWKGFTSVCGLRTYIFVVNATVKRRSYSRTWRQVVDE